MRPFPRSLIALCFVVSCLVGAAPATAHPDPTVVMPPAWAFGVLYGGYTDQRQSLERVQRLIDEDYPIDAYWVDSWFWNFVDHGAGPRGYLDFRGDRAAFPDRAALWETFRRRNVKAGIWVWDAVLQTGNEAVFDDFHRRGFFERTYRNRDGWHNRGKDSLCGEIDFANPEAAAYWQGLLRPFFDDGLDFLKLDRSTSIDYLRTAYEATARLGRETGGRGLILSHMGEQPAPQAKLYPLRWSSDCVVAWTRPTWPDKSIPAFGAFRENVQMVADTTCYTYECARQAQPGGMEVRHS